MIESIKKFFSEICAFTDNPWGFILTEFGEYLLKKEEEEKKRQEEFEKKAIEVTIYLVDAMIKEAIRRNPDALQMDRAKPDLKLVKDE